MTECSVRDLTNFLDGSEDVTKLKELVYTFIRRDKHLYHPKPFDMTEREARMWSVKQLHRWAVVKIYSRQRVIEVGQNTDSDFWECLVHTMSSYDSSFEFRAGVHFGLFGNAVLTQGTKEQIDQWFTQMKYAIRRFC